MRAFIQRQQPVIVTAVVVGTLVAFGPGVAQAAYDAVNADRVDGKHAVGAGTTVAGRAGKLVATNSNGLLPNNIIATAPNAAKLGGVGPLGWLRDQPGSVDSENIADGSVTPDDLRYDAGWPSAFGRVTFYGTLDTAPTRGFDGVSIVKPEGTSGLYCLGGFGFSPWTVTANGSLVLSGPNDVYADLGAGADCAGVEGTQITVYSFATGYPYPATDSAFNLQVWGS